MVTMTIKKMLNDFNDNRIKKILSQGWFTLQCFLYALQAINTSLHILQANGLFPIGLSTVWSTPSGPPKHKNRLIYSLIHSFRST